MRLGNYRWVLIVLGVIVFLALALMFSIPHFYLFVRVDQQEVGVRFRAGRIYQVVGPGVYSDFGWYATIQKISGEAVAFSVEDPEVITKDRQRVGLAVSGDVFRPDIGQANTLRELWPRYRGLYIDDEALRARVADFALQAMKSCVGDRTFNDNVIGSARDELRVCIDDQISELASNMGLDIRNVTVPNVILSTAAQASLDAITQSRLDTELATQDAIKAAEQARADQVRQEGEVRVALSRQQEEVRQQATLAQLQQELLEVERAVIEAEKANELLAAQKDLQINQARAEAAESAANAELAKERVLAELYAESPAYAYLQAVLANASALTEADKVIFTQEGTTPSIVVPGAGIMPTVETSPTALPSEE